MDGSSLFSSSSRAGCRRGFTRGELSLRRRRLLVSVASVVKWSQRSLATEIPAAKRMGGNRP